MAFRAETLRYTVLSFTLLSYFFLEWPVLCDANTTNTIKSGQVLSYSEKLLVSADGRFQLGFFNDSSSSNGFLGMRYTIKDFDDMVWVANRDMPFSGVNAMLALDTDGLLKITHGEAEEPIPLNSNRTAPNSTVTLENSGNLVVRELSSDGSVKRVLWESFDYPTDTLLPGMKLGVSLVTGRRWILTSWLSKDNPETGAFTLEYNHSGKHSQEVFVVRRRGHLFSRNGPDVIGPWGEKQISYVSNKEGIYFNFSGGNIINLGLKLNPDGSISHITTNVSGTILNGCSGDFEFPYYCAEQGTPACRSSDDVFVRRGILFLDNVSSSTSYWNNYSSWDYNSSNVISDCFQRCASNCSCVGFNSIFTDETGCIFYSKGARFTVSNYTDRDYVFLLNSSYKIPVAEKSESGCNGSGNKWWICVMIYAVASVWF